MERVSVWPWYTDNSKDKETALLQTSNLSILSLPAKKLVHLAQGTP